MRSLLIGVLLLITAASQGAYAAEQKILFCCDSYEYGYFSKETCKPKCDVACGLQDLLSDGWSIVSTAPKKIVKQDWFDGEKFGCTCVGTQYVLSKVDAKLYVPQDNKNIELLKREIELLKKENDMLKQENDALKAKSNKKNKLK